MTAMKGGHRKLVPKHGRIAIAILSLSTSMISVAGPAATNPSVGDADVQPATSVSVTPKLSASAVVSSTPEISITARAEGVLEAFHSLPGISVKAGDLLGRLSGPVREAAIQRAKADVDRAQANLKLALDLKEGLSRSPEGLVTASQRQTAENAAATAAIDLGTAKVAMDVLISTGEIRASVDGTITAVLATDGQQVAADTALLRVQPAKILWLDASYWSDDAAKLALGMLGKFTPADGSAPTEVRLVRILSPVRADGGTLVACEKSRSDETTNTKSASPTWRMGQAGTLELFGDARREIEVPTSALVMSAGGWWVVVHTHDGDEPKQVEPGAEDGPRTIIRSGISVGESIVISDAYLHFHHDFAKQYQQPD